MLLSGIEVEGERTFAIMAQATALRISHYYTGNSLFDYSCTLFKTAKQKRYRYHGYGQGLERQLRKENQAHGKQLAGGLCSGRRTYEQESLHRP